MYILMMGHTHLDMEVNISHSCPSARDSVFNYRQICSPVMFVPVTLPVAQLPCLRLQARTTGLMVLAGTSMFQAETEVCFMMAR